MATLSVQGFTMIRVTLQAGLSDRQSLGLLIRVRY